MHRELKNVILEQSMCMETRNSKTEMPLFKVKDEKFIFAVQINCKVNVGLWEKIGWKKLN